MCGELDEVDAIVAPIRMRRGARRTERFRGAQSERFVVGATGASHPRWEPLLYLCFARLDSSARHDDAIAIARRLLDHGADPNAYFMAGNSRYSPLTGLFGGGEESRDRASAL